ncbi:MAG: hypothetical protein RL033_121 [Pseudomonadota bacterium]
MGCVLLSLFASGSLLTRGALAQDDEPPAGALLREPEPPPADEPALREESSPPSSAATQEPSSSAAVLGVELLTAEAFPSPQPRGIPGGSLSATMHGLQWPYMPARSGAAATRLGFSGSAWVDSSYRKVDGGIADADLKEWGQQSRFVLRATPTYNAPGEWFVQGQGEVVLLGATPPTTQENLGTDDLYVRVGKWNVFDFTAGRFQGWEVYHLGMGLDQNTPERNGASTTQNPALDISKDLQFLWDRRDGPGNLALHFYPLDFFRIELLGRVGSTSRNELGLRPAGILDFGIIKAKIAGDYVKESPREQQPDRKDRSISRGVVGSVQVVLEPVLEAGVSGGYALKDDYNAQGVLNAAGSNTTYSFGGFANVSVTDGVVLGAGAAYTHQHNLKVDATGTLNDIKTHTQLFGAVQYALWEQLYIKAVVAYANALFDPQSDPMPATFRNKSLSARIRLGYAF